MKVALHRLYGDVFREREDFSMPYTKALRIAERTLIDEATLAELRQASNDLRAMTPDSALAELVDARIEYIESGRGASRFVSPERSKSQS